MTIDSTTVYVILVILFAGVIRSTLGFGGALIAVPLLSLRVPVTVAVPLSVLVSVAGSAVVVAQDWRKIQVRSVAGLLIAALFGIPLGLLLLTQANANVVKVVLGFLITTFSIYSLTAKTTLHLEQDHPLWLLGSGFCSGVLAGAYGMGGPPLVVYGSLRRWSPQHFRATLQGFFLLASCTSLVGYVAMGLLVPTLTRYFLFSLPGLLVGTLVGRSLNQRMRGDGFFRVVYVGLVVVGGTLIAQALTHRAA